ncbi:MAG: 2Fe-2S iron-sulfur cluster-binding protein, partial [Deltaproteobacteria bacterium]
MSQDRWIRYAGTTYRLRPDERALDALLRGGAPVNFSCRKGTCRSCMLQVTSGTVGENAVKTLPQDMREAGFFLPCCADDIHRVEATAPDLSLCAVTAMVVEKQWLAPDILRVKFEPERVVDWFVGQTITLSKPNGESRPYSIVSLPEDYYLTVDMRI